MPRLRKFKRKGIIYDIVSQVDTTLTQENFPADSKTVGNRLDELETMIENIEVSGEVTSKTEVFNADTHFDFPSIGSVDCIYKAYKEKKTYQWNAETLVYEPLNESAIENINLINGGNADGIL